MEECRRKLGMGLDVESEHPWKEAAKLWAQRNEDRRKPFTQNAGPSSDAVTNKFIELEDRIERLELQIRILSARLMEKEDKPTLTGGTYRG